MFFIVCCIWMTKFSNHNPIIDDKSIDNPLLNGSLSKLYTKKAIAQVEIHRLVR